MSNSLIKYKQLTILGGGSSLSEGISKGLWDKLKNCFVIGTNYSYLYYPNPTIQTFVDSQFYTKESKKEKFKKLPLIVGKEHNQLKVVLPNTITLKTNDSKYYRNIKLGIWKSSLVGIFALSLAIYLEPKEIFLLGYDFGTINNRTDDKGRRITHFYQKEIEHRGIGKTNYFEGEKRADKDFGVYANEKKVRIYNVSLNSKINTFPKISYDEFFRSLNSEHYDQVNIREYIKEKLS